MYVHMAALSFTRQLNTHIFTHTHTYTLTGRNPSFYNWNTVYVKYCDGGFFSGDVLEPQYYEGNALYFRGAHIHKPLINDMMTQRGMDKGT
jgi:hypothetical protein